MSTRNDHTDNATCGDAIQIDRKYLDKQSRTIGTYGLETMSKLISFKILVIGCGGVGIELAKNLALAGVHTIRLYDPRVCTVKDMGANFAVTEEAVGQQRTRAEVSQGYISELNPCTRVHVTTELSESVVSQHTAVIFTAAAPDLSLSTLCRWNSFCRTHQPVISFMLAMQVGAMASVFVDHGDQFTVRDADGRPMLQKSVLDVHHYTDKAGQSYSRILFETPDGQTPGALRDYTSIQFSEVRGLTKTSGDDGGGQTQESVNGKSFFGVVCPSDPRNTVRVYPSFAEQGYSDYDTGGFIHEQKERRTLSFRSLRTALQSPSSFVPVSPMMDNSEESQSHLLLHALLCFAEAHAGRLPQLHSREDAAAVLHCAQQIQDANRLGAAELAQAVPKGSPAAHDGVDDAGSRDNANHASASMTSAEFPYRPAAPPAPVPLVVDQIQTDILSVQAMIAAAELQPLGSFLGAVVAQEVVKITGRYTPIHQWFHLRCDDVLPHTESERYARESHPGGEYAGRGDRYDLVRHIFGHTFHDKLAQLSVFMVGCGALGCENIKNFALCGITCGEHGSFVVTDNDSIEVSNLSRQFLFREENVGQCKSSAAAARMLQMNRHSHVDARTDFVGVATETLFPDTFWHSLDVVVNALDNMEARLYVDARCVMFHKILVEAGTMGTGGNVDIIVPGQTSSYADGGAADQTGGIPMCTLRNFPYIFDHCIEWARAQFDDLFVAPLRMAHQIIDEPEQFVQRIQRELAHAQSDGERRSLVEKHTPALRRLRDTLRVLCDGPTMTTCVQLAWATMFRLFRDRILDLHAAFPRDARRKNGTLFWSGHRKYPSALPARSADDVLSSTASVDAESSGRNTHSHTHTERQGTDALPRAGVQEAGVGSQDMADFLIAASNVYALALGVHPAKPQARYNDEAHRWMAEYREVGWLSSVIATWEVPFYTASVVDGLEEDLAADATTKKNGSGSDGSNTDDELELRELLATVRRMADEVPDSVRRVCPVEFEKDDDDNFHMDFVTAASNLRAANYQIERQDRLRVKLVAGKIIPAVATTTSAVTGLSLLELFKVLQGKTVSTLRNGMLDVGTNNYVLFERDPPLRYHSKVVSTYLPEQNYTYRKKLIRVPEGFSKYDHIRIPVSACMTVAQFAAAVEATLQESDAPATQDATSAANGTATHVPRRFVVDGIGVGKGLVWNGQGSHGNTNVPLLQVIARQKLEEQVMSCSTGSGGSGGVAAVPAAEDGAALVAFWKNRLQFCDLAVTVSLEDEEDDEGEEPVDEVDVETATICVIPTLDV